MTSADGVATVCIQRPEVMNALDAVTMRELSEVFDELASDDALKGVILTGYNGALVGADISELANLKTQQEGEEIGRKGHAVLRRIECFSKPVVAVLNGPVMGGGAELSMACHARIVGSRVTVSQPEVNLGIIPGYGGTQRLPRIVGWERALEMLRLGRPIDAETACAWGWAEGAVASDPIAAAEQLIAAHWAGSETVSPVASAPMNVPAEWPHADLGHRSRTIDAILVDVLRRGLACSLEEGLAIEAEGVGRAVITVDFDIGMKNFAQNGPRVPAMFLHE